MCISRRPILVSCQCDFMIRLKSSERCVQDSGLVQGLRAQGLGLHVLGHDNLHRLFGK